MSETVTSVTDRNTVASTLFAQLLAKEAINVRFERVRIPRFYPQFRDLVLPLWKKLTDEELYLMIGHEVGHALYTPHEMFDHDKCRAVGKNFRGYLNVAEDARIEHKTKSEYPGLRRLFIAGYRSLLEHRDYFKTQTIDVRTMALIDRLNIATKCGALVPELQLTADEQVWYDRLMATREPQEAWDVAAALYNHVKEMKRQAREEKARQERERKEAERKAREEERRRREAARKAQEKAEQDEPEDATDSQEELAEEEDEAGDDLIEAPEQETEEGEGGEEGEQVATEEGESEVTSDSDESEIEPDEFEDESLPESGVGKKELPEDDRDPDEVDNDPVADDPDPNPPAPEQPEQNEAVNDEQNEEDETTIEDADEADEDASDDDLDSQEGDAPSDGGREADNGGYGQSTDVDDPNIKDDIQDEFDPDVDDEDPDSPPARIPGGDGDEDHEGGATGGDSDDATDEAGDTDDEESTDEEDGDDAGDADEDETTDDDHLTEVGDRALEDEANEDDEEDDEDAGAYTDADEADESITADAANSLLDTDRLKKERQPMKVAQVGELMDPTPYITPLHVILEHTQFRDRAKLEAAFRDWKNEQQPVINAMVQQFRAKAMAHVSRRARTAPTGRLDLTKLARYRFDDNIFARNTILPGGVNHGVVSFVDWSGSMLSQLGDVLRQALAFALFAEAVNIPFDLYAFTDEEDAYKFHRVQANKVLPTLADKKTADEMSAMGLNPANLKSGKINIDVLMRPLYSTTLNQQARKTALLRLFGLMLVAEINEGNVFMRNERLERVRAYGFDNMPFDNGNGEHDQLMGAPFGDDLHGTPLDSAIVVGTSIVDLFRKQHRLEKVAVVWLTDGESTNSLSIGNWVVKTYWDRDEHKYLDRLQWEVSPGSQLEIIDYMIGRRYVSETPELRHVDRAKQTLILFQWHKDRTKATVIGCHIGHDLGDAVGRLLVGGQSAAAKLLETAPVGLIYKGKGTGQKVNHYEEFNKEHIFTTDQTPFDLYCVTSPTWWSGEVSKKVHEALHEMVERTSLQKFTQLIVPYLAE